MTEVVDIIPHVKQHDVSTDSCIYDDRILLGFHFRFTSSVFMCMLASVHLDCASFYLFYDSASLGSSQDPVWMQTLRSGSSLSPEDIRL